MKLAIMLRSEAVLKGSLDQLMARAGDFEVDRVDAVRDVEAMVGLIPMAAARIR